MHRSNRQPSFTKKGPGRYHTKSYHMTVPGFIGEAPVMRRYATPIVPKVRNPYAQEKDWEPNTIAAHDRRVRERLEERHAEK